MSTSSAASSSLGSEPDCPTVPFSFELFPPRTEQATRAVRETVAVLAAAHPEYISVTYGANGSSRDASIDLLRHILDTTSVRPLAHLTCVGSSYAEATTVIREFLEAGVSSFLALRGDPPRGSSEDDVVLGDLGSASELVQLIHRVQAERMPYIEEDVPGLPRASRVKDGRRRLEVSVAAFPNGHPRSNAGFHDVDALLAKQVAGADFAITQLFFHADDYLGFVERARDGGVTMPIVPGIMPVTTPTRLRRIAELSGQDVPVDLIRSLEDAPDDDVRFRIGVAHASDLARTVIVGGAPSLHLYTFNQHHAALAVLRECGLVPSPPIKEYA
ncbi:methylenetetrahydrofolate reductase [Herbiconiux sp. CPCC 205763]|uniref:Methylenetetrahydrofolate reductase n=1 Tax=Herbiconiux aconitum TaxID=2970913 RepID=A0ABT2GVN1_9MICO|nr:methylenetetrahydrofolate reductase [Herbiconiux aconitum]MCS5720265.1 methylenetetrahydrofolate reductase [Herbiconiux aconitum]